MHCGPSRWIARAITSPVPVPPVTSTAASVAGGEGTSSSTRSIARLRCGHVAAATSFQVLPPHRQRLRSDDPRPAGRRCCEESGFRCPSRWPLPISDSAACASLRSCRRGARRRARLEPSCRHRCRPALRPAAVRLVGIVRATEDRAAVFQAHVIRNVEQVPRRC